MPLKKRKLINYFLMLFLCFGLVTHAQAIGFGKLTLYSYLNEPLHAEIDLLATEDIDETQLAVQLASSKDFVRTQLSRPFFLTKLAFSIIKEPDRTFIFISTKEVVKQPFLDFLVELAWPQGRLVKRYTILLDPLPVNPALRAFKPRPKYQSKALARQMAFPAQPKRPANQETQQKKPAFSPKPPVDPEIVDLFEPLPKEPEPSEMPERIPEKMSKVIPEKISQPQQAIEPQAQKSKLATTQPEQLAALPDFKLATDNLAKQPVPAKPKSFGLSNIKNNPFLKKLFHVLIGLGLLFGAGLVVYKTLQQRRLKAYLEQEQAEFEDLVVSDPTPDLEHDTFQDLDQTQDHFVADATEPITVEDPAQSTPNTMAIKESLQMSQKVFQDLDQDPVEVESLDLDSAYATKMNLAKNYIELGDLKSAKEALEDLKPQATPEQQTEINQMLASL